MFYQNCSLQWELLVVYWSMFQFTGIVYSLVFMIPCLQISLRGRCVPSCCCSSCSIISPSTRDQPPKVWWLGMGHWTHMCFHCTYSTSRKSLNKCLTSGCVLRLRPPTYWIQFTLHSSCDIGLHLCVHICICMCLRASVYIHIRCCIGLCLRLRAFTFAAVLAHVCVCVHASAPVWFLVHLCACVCVCVCASAFVCVQNIKHLDTFRRKWISRSVSGHVFDFQDVL